MKLFAQESSKNIEGLKQEISESIKKYEQELNLIKQEPIKNIENYT